MEPTYSPGILAITVPERFDAALPKTIVMSFHIPVGKISVLSTWPHFHYASLLRPLERQLIMNLLWLESAIPMSTMSAWVTQEGRKYEMHITLRSPPSDRYG